jgi:hypothetical protein
VAKDVEHFFMDLLAICTSFENSPIHLPLSIGLFVLLENQKQNKTTI